MAYVSCLATVSFAYPAEVKIVGPSEMRPGEVHEFAFKARNDDIPGQQTRSIDWRVTASSELLVPAPVKPSTFDFFSDEDWNAYPTFDTLMTPPVASGRFTQSQSDLAQNKPWCNVAIYAAQLTADYSGPFPASATISLPTNDLIFWQPGWVEDPNVTNLTPVFDVTILPTEGDVNGDGSKDMLDVETIVSVLMGADLDPNHHDWCDFTGEGEVDGKDIPGFVEAITQ